MLKHIPIFHFSSLYFPNTLNQSILSFSYMLLQFFTTILMALPSNLFLTFALTSIFLSSLTPFSGGIKASSSSSSSSRDEEELRKMVLGSRPPGCVNKCMNCRPCEATLVIPPHQSKKMKWKWANNYEESSHRENDSYYLLLWKCRCGNKLYQP